MGKRWWEKAERDHLLTPETPRPPVTKQAAPTSAWALRGTQHPCDNAPLLPTQPILLSSIQLVPNNRCIAGETSLFHDLDSGGQPWLLWVKNQLSTPTAGLPRCKAFSAVSPTTVFPKPLWQSWGKSGPCLLGSAASSFSLTPSSTVHGGNPHPRGLFCLRGSAEPCSSARSHFKGENSEARRQSRPSQGAQPAEAARCPNLHPPAPPLHYAAHPGRGGAPTDMSLLYSSRRCRLDAMNRPPFWIQPVCSPVSSSRSRLTTRLVWARSSTSTSLGLSCHSRPGGRGVGGGRRQPLAEGLHPLPPPGRAPKYQAAGLKCPCRPSREPREADEQETTGATLSSRTRPLGSSETDNTKGPLYQAPGWAEPVTG